MTISEVEEQFVTRVPLNDNLWQLVLNRPERRNALGTLLARQFCEAARQAIDAGAKAIILDAQGPAFCSGADLTEARSGAANQVLNTVAKSRVPWLACVRGPAIGAGSALVAVCAFSIMSDGAWFALPEVRALGRYPVGMTRWIAPVTGMRPLLRPGLSGDRISAAYGQSLGWITQRVPADHFDAERQATLRWVGGLNPAVLAQAQDCWRNHLTAWRSLLNTPAPDS